MGTPLSMSPIPAPPHDPSSLLLNGRFGWRDAAPGKLESIERDPCDGALRLAYLAATARTLTEASGSLGGLRLPGNAALGPDESLFCSTASTRGCAASIRARCAFERVPCLGGEGGGARELRNPGDIAICGGNLFVVRHGRGEGARGRRVR